MRKLVIFQGNSDSDYKNELEYCFQLFEKENSCLSIRIEDLDINFLQKNDIQVVISNTLSLEWFFILKGLKIVSIIIGVSEGNNYLADIIIDYKSNDRSKYFTGQEYSFFENRNDKIEFSEILNLIKKLEWDTDFFNLNIAYLSCRHLTDNIIHHMNSFINNEKINLLEYLCNCHDSRSVILAEKNQFHFTDIRLTFEKVITEKINSQIEAPFAVKLAEKIHIEDLKAISSNIYKDSRYYFDGKFDEKKINDFYQSWVEKAVLGTFDHECHAIFHIDKPVGFCTIRYYPSNSAQIGLFGISSNYQGKGLALKLIHSVINKLQEKLIKKVYVVTQGRNYSAQRIYQKAGFLTKSTELWYHKWI